MKRKTKEDEERKTQHAQLLGKELKQTVRVWTMKNKNWTNLCCVYDANGNSDYWSEGGFILLEEKAMKVDELIVNVIKWCERLCGCLYWLVSLSFHEKDGKNLTLWYKSVFKNYNRACEV